MEIVRLRRRGLINYLFYFAKFDGVSRHISSFAEITVSLTAGVTAVHIQDTYFRSQVRDLRDTE
jgi:hypothetical protein